jgi:predicted nucleotide-binding protein
LAQGFYAMIDGEEWISASDALRLVSPLLKYSAASTICTRAHAGLIRARAAHITVNDQPMTEKEIPKRFWWAKGEAALDQNWRSGDFGTWFEREKHIQAFGVEFLRSDIEKLIPKSVIEEKSPRVTAVKYSNKIFIVHGRDEGPREAVANVLKKLGLEPIILNQLPNRSRAVIEKIEEHSDVGFAVVLLTPDDEGNLKGKTPKARARQNVLLELGYFLGVLTRRRVCVLVKGEVEIPSDWAGVINEEYDDLSPAWKMMLIRELKDAGYDIDANKVLG